jgi:hypothetical protein
MKPRERIARRSLHQIIGIAACAGAAGPVFLLMYMLGGLEEVAEIWSKPLLDLIQGCATASLFGLPVAIMIAIGAHVLGRRNNDTFMKSAACGTAISFIAISITSEIAVGGSPLTEPENVREIALLLLGSFIMSALYWLVAVRQIRRQRGLAEQHERAVKAME